MRPLLLLLNLLPLLALPLLLRRDADPPRLPARRWFIAALLWGGLIAPLGALASTRPFTALSVAARAIILAPLIEEAFKAGGLLLLRALAQSPPSPPSPHPTHPPHHALWLGVTLGLAFATTENALALLTYTQPDAPFAFLSLRLLLPTLMHTLTAALLAWLPALAPPHDAAARWLLLPALAFALAALLHSAHNAVTLTLASPLSLTIAALLPPLSLLTLHRLHRLSLKLATQHPPPPAR